MLRRTQAQYMTLLHEAAPAPSLHVYVHGNLQNVLVSGLQFSRQSFLQLTVRNKV